MYMHLKINKFNKTRQECSMAFNWIEQYMIGLTINNNVIPLHCVSRVISPIFKCLLQLF